MNNLIYYFIYFSLLSLTSSIKLLNCLDPRDYGAIEGNPSDGLGPNWERNTVAIQTAIDEASGEATNDEMGCVELIGGDYVSSDIYMKSNIMFRINDDSRLLNAVNVTKRGLLIFDGIKNVILTGPGIVYGNAEFYISYYDPVDDRYQPTFDDGDRPRLVYLESSNDILINNIKIQNASDWHLHAVGCKNVTVDRVSIYGDWRFPNNDGIDPDSCVDFTITNSDINVADDGICPKASEGFGPLTNLYVQNVTIRSKSHAIKFGTNTDTEMSDVIFEDVTIWDSNGGLAIQSRSPGNIHNITYRNIRIETRHVAPRWWGNGEWLTMTTEPRYEDTIVGETYNILFENIYAVTENGGLISNLVYGVQGLVMRNVSVVLDRWSNYSTGDGPLCQKADPEGTGDNEIPCMGTQDHRPSYTEDINCSYYCRTPAAADGLYLQNVQGAILHDVSVEFKGTVEEVPYWGKCLVVDNQSSISSNLNFNCINEPD